jgi:hypothetical protein
LGDGVGINIFWNLATEVSIERMEDKEFDRDALDSLPPLLTGVRDLGLGLSATESFIAWKETLE